MPIPYMGSKRDNASLIYQTIVNFCPDADTVVDLFCGGFAVGEWFMRQGWRVIANDVNRYVVALLDEVVNRGLDESRCLEFVTRQKFEDVTKNPSSYDDWYVGYVQCVWSFGNNGNGYMFGRDSEPFKIAGHELVVNRNPEPVGELIAIPDKYIVGILSCSDWHKRRIAFGKVIRQMQIKDRRWELQQLQQLQQLERLERLQQLQQLQLSAVDYQEVNIPAAAVVYCDPPYAGTAEYVGHSFDHNRFWEWATELAVTNPVFVSEYSAPEPWRPVLSWSQHSRLPSNGMGTSQPDEKLFTILG